MLSALKEGAESRRWKKAESTDEKFNVYRIKNWNIHNNYRSGVSKKTLFKCSDLLSQNRNICSKNEKKTNIIMLRAALLYHEFAQVHNSMVPPIRHLFLR